jgi:hypothetical protein
MAKVALGVSGALEAVEAVEVVEAVWAVGPARSWVHWAVGVVPALLSDLGSHLSLEVASMGTRPIENAM